MSAVEALFKVKMSSKGQVVIPKHLREALNLKEGDDLLLIPTKGGILMKPPNGKKRTLRGILKGLKVEAAECEAILSEAKRSLTKTIEPSAHE